MLQKLDHSSLTCTAVACSKLSRTVPAAISSLEVRCSSADTCSSIDSWFGQHSTSLTSLRQCSTVVYRGNIPRLLVGHHRYYVQLRQLTLNVLPEVQDDSADGFPGFLHDCRGLTALDMQLWGDQTTAAAAAAIAALPALQSLKLADDPWAAHMWVLTMDGSPATALQQLTHLSLGWRSRQPEDAAKLCQLSRLVNLGHLKLMSVPNEGQAACPLSC